MPNKLVIKLLMLGDANVGKTCLMQRFTENRYTGQYNCTVGMDSKVRTIEISGTQVKLHIWDTAGEERFRAVVAGYYRSVHGIMLVFDLTNRQSFQHIDYWLEEVKKYASRKVRIMLVGNKCDAENREVWQQSAGIYANTRKIMYMEASAMTGANVERMFYKLAVSVYDLNLKLEQEKRGKKKPDEDSNSVTLRQGTGTRTFCC